MKFHHNKPVKESVKFVHEEVDTAQTIPHNILLTEIHDKEPDTLSEELGSHVICAVLNNKSDDVVNTPTSLPQISLHGQNNVQDVDITEKGDNTDSVPPACPPYQDVQITLVSTPESCTNMNNSSQLKQGRPGCTTSPGYEPPEKEGRVEEPCVLGSTPESQPCEGELVFSQKKSNFLALAHKGTKPSELLSGGSDGEYDQSSTSEVQAPEEEENPQCDDNSILLTGDGVVYSHKFSAFKARVDIESHDSGNSDLSQTAADSSGQTHRQLLPASSTLVQVQHNSSDTSEDSKKSQCSSTTVLAVDHNGLLVILRRSVLWSCSGILLASQSLTLISSSGCFLQICYSELHSLKPQFHPTVVWQHLQLSICMQLDALFDEYAACHFLVRPTSCVSRDVTLSKVWNSQDGVFMQQSSKQTSTECTDSSFSTSASIRRPLVCARHSFCPELATQQAHMSQYTTGQSNSSCPHTELLQEASDTCFSNNLLPVYNPGTQSLETEVKFSGLLHQHSTQDSSVSSHDIVFFTHSELPQNTSDTYLYCLNKPPSPHKVRHVTSLSAGDQGILSMIIHLLSSSKTWSLLMFKHTHDIQQTVHFRARQVSSSELATLLLQFLDAQLKQTVERLYCQCMTGTLMAVSVQSSDAYCQISVLCVLHESPLSEVKALTLSLTTSTTTSSLLESTSSVATLKRYLCDCPDTCLYLTNTVPVPAGTSSYSGIFRTEHSQRCRILRSKLSYQGGSVHGATSGCSGDTPSFTSAPLQSNYSMKNVFQASPFTKCTSPLTGSRVTKLQATSTKPPVLPKQPFAIENLNNSQYTAVQGSGMISQLETSQEICDTPFTCSGVAHQYTSQDSSKDSRAIGFSHIKPLPKAPDRHWHCSDKPPLPLCKVVTSSAGTSSQGKQTERPVIMLSGSEQDILSMLFQLLSSSKSGSLLTFEHTHNIWQMVHFRGRQGSTSELATLLLQFLDARLKQAVERLYCQYMSTLMAVSVQSSDAYCQISVLCVLHESPLSEVKALTLSLTTSTTTSSLLESNSSVATLKRYLCDWQDTFPQLTNTVQPIMHPGISYPVQSRILPCKVPSWGGGVTTAASSCSGDMPFFSSMPSQADHSIKNVIQGSPSDECIPPLTGSAITKFQGTSTKPPMLPDCSQSVRMHYPQYSSELNPRSQELLMLSTSPPPCNFVMPSGAGVTATLSTEHKAANTRGILDRSLPHPNTIGTTVTPLRVLFPQGKEQHNGLSPPSQMKSFSDYNKCSTQQPIAAIPNVTTHSPVTMQFSKHKVADTKGIPDKLFLHPNTIRTMSVGPRVQQGKEQHNGLSPPSNAPHTTPSSHSRYSTQQTNVAVPKAPKQPSVFTKPQKVTDAHRTISTFTGGEPLWTPTPRVLAISLSPVSTAPLWNNARLQDLDLSPTSSERDTEECTDGGSQDSGQKSRNVIQGSPTDKCTSPLTGNAIAKSKNMSTKPHVQPEWPFAIENFNSCIKSQYTAVQGSGMTSQLDTSQEICDTPFTCSGVAHQYTSQDSSKNSHAIGFSHIKPLPKAPDRHWHCSDKPPLPLCKVVTSSAGTSSQGKQTERPVIMLSGSEQDILSMLFQLLSSSKSGSLLTFEHTHNIWQMVHFRGRQGSTSELATLLLQFLDARLKQAVERLYCQYMSTLMAVSVQSSDAYCQISVLCVLHESPLSEVKALTLSLTTSTTTSSLLESNSSVATLKRYLCDWQDTFPQLTNTVQPIMHPGISYPVQSRILPCKVPSWGGGVTTAASSCSGDMPFFSSMPSQADHSIKNVIQGSPSDECIPPLTGSAITKFQVTSTKPFILPDCSQSVRMYYPQYSSELNPRSQELLMLSTSPPPCNFVMPSGAGVTATLSTEHKAANTRGILDRSLPHPNTIGTTVTPLRVLFPQGKEQHNGLSPPSQMKSFSDYNKCSTQQPIAAIPNVTTHSPVTMQFSKHKVADTKGIPDKLFLHPNTIRTMSVGPRVQQGKEQHNGLSPPSNAAHTTPPSYSRYSTQQTNVAVPKAPKQPSVFTKPQNVTDAHRTISTFTGGECLWTPTPSVLAVSPSPVGLFYPVSTAPLWNNTQLQDHQQGVNLVLSPTSSEWDTEECTDGGSQDSGQKSRNSDSSESSGGQGSSSESGGGGAGDGEAASGGGGTGGGADGGGGAGGGGGGKDRNGVSNDHDKTKKDQQENESQKKTDSGLGSTVPSSANVDHDTREQLPSTPQKFTPQTQMHLSQNKEPSFNTSPSNYSTLHTQEVASFNEGVKDETHEPQQEESHNTIGSSEESVVPSGTPLTTQPDATSSKQGRNLNDEDNLKVHQESHPMGDFLGELAMLQPHIFQKLVAIPPGVVDSEETCLPSTHTQGFIDTTSGETVPRLECFEDYLPLVEQEVASHASGAEVENSAEMHPGSPKVYTETASVQQTALQDPVKCFVAPAECKSMEDLPCSQSIEESNSSAHCQARAVFIHMSVSCYKHAHIIIQERIRMGS